MDNLTKLIVLVMTIGMFFNANGQSIDKQGFKVYLLQGRYNESTRAYLNQNSNFDKYAYLGEYMIDPKKTGIYTEQRIKSAVIKLFPNSRDNGLLSLNIESKIYKDLMHKGKNSPDFRKAEAEFIRIVNIIKKIRPNVRIGIYGLPFRFYYSSQRKFNANNKLDNLLSHLDYISPSLYVVYPDKEKGTFANEKYVRSNLEYSLEVGKRLNKPVIPYVWHIVHPSNKKYGGNLVDRNELRKYLRLIANYTWNGKKTSGVIWWESSSKSFNSYMDRSRGSGQRLNGMGNQSDVIRYYTKDLFNNL